MHLHVRETNSESGIAVPGDEVKQGILRREALQVEINQLTHVIDEKEENQVSTSKWKIYGGINGKLAKRFV